MSRNRSLQPNDAFPRVKGRCRVCGSHEIPKGRSTTCSRACADRIKVVCFPTWQRFRVEDRDRGVCAACGTDTEKLHRVLRVFRRWSERAVILERLGFDGSVKTATRRTLWDMDHIVPVSEGGGVSPDMTVEQVLDNLRTLCIACHRDETARLAARKARRRRRNPQLQLAI